MTDNKLIDITNNFDISHCDDLCNNNICYFDGSYDEFFHKFLQPNVPCIIRNATSSWKCSSWVKNNKPNIDYLVSKYGDAMVPVANCNEQYFNAQRKNDMKFSEFAEYWKNFIQSGYPASESCLYLKDWHFTEDFPDENIYVVPPEFCSDWLNEYHTTDSELKSDYKFVYMGPKGSWTPFHFDVFASYSWSVNVCGEKKWILLPPGEEKKMKNKFGDLPYDINDEYCNKFNISYLSVIQKPGDALFVPSGWHHQVWNSMDTISINHNWVNGCNIDKMWIAMKLNLEDVKKEISSFKDTMSDWHDHCQLILKSSFGMDFKDFYKFLIFILKSRTLCLETKTNLCVYGGWIIGQNYLHFDYISVQKTIDAFKNDIDVKLLLTEKNLKDLID